MGNPPRTIMATHRLGHETVNVSVNLLDQERRILARLAVAENGGGLIGVESAAVCVTVLGR